MTKPERSFREKVIEGFLQLTSPARAGAVTTYAALTAAFFTQMATT